VVYRDLVFSNFSSVTFGSPPGVGPFTGNLNPFCNSSLSPPFSCPSVPGRWSVKYQETIERFLPSAQFSAPYLFSQLFRSFVFSMLLVKPPSCSFSKSLFKSLLYSFFSFAHGLFSKFTFRAQGGWFFPSFLYPPPGCRTSVSFSRLSPTSS